MPRLLLAALLTVLAAGLTACGGDSSSSGGGGGSRSPRTTATSTAATASTTTKAAAPPAPGKGCRGVVAPRPKRDGGLSAPKRRLSSSKRYAVRMTTNCGTFEFSLDVRRAPKTTSSVASLVRRGFFDDLTFHRIAHAPDGGPFVIQGGDPTGTGNGGPGYSVTETPPRNLRYTKGMVAMAKTGAEPPGTSGSQFYVVTAGDAGLPPEYALVGKVVKGMDTVTRIANVDAGPPPAESPLSPVVIEKAQLLAR